MNTIPNELASQFTTQAGRKKLVQQYGNSETMYSGINEDGESVTVSIDRNGIVLDTYQSNGWVRVNYYDADGCSTGETFDGRWR